MINVKTFDFIKHSDPQYGSLTAIEVGKELPFAVNRAYYIYDVPSNTRRGFHSHFDLQQMLICVRGSVKILVKTPFEEEMIELSNPNKGLYIGPMIWREMFDFSSDAVLLVLASKEYDKEDYIRDYSEYETAAQKYFNK